MKFVCTRENLQKAIQTTARIVSSRAGLPILSNILLTTDGGRIKIAATDLEVGLVYWVGAKVEKPGGLAVPARLIADLISNIDEEKLSLESKNTDLEIKGERYSATIKSFDPEEYPLIPTFKEEAVFELAGDQLKEILSSVVFAASADTTRMILTGILFKKTEHNLVVAATDSYRLAERKIKISKKGEGFSFVVPQRVALELIRLCSLTESSARVILGENQVIFSFDDFYLVSRIIDGQYPNYEQIIPEATQTKVVVSTADFNRATKIASLFAKELAGNIKLETRGNKKLIVASEASQVGSNSAELEAEITGPPIDISFNAKYILDMTSGVESKKITLGFNGKLSPGVIKPDNREDYVHIIMPLRS